MDDWRTVRVMPRAEMLKRVARFKELKGSEKGLPDSHLPESHKTLYAVIGFAPPEEKLNEATFSPLLDARGDRGPGQRRQHPGGRERRRRVPARKRPAPRLLPDRRAQQPAARDRPARARRARAGERAARVVAGVPAALVARGAARRWENAAGAMHNNTAIANTVRGFS